MSDRELEELATNTWFDFESDLTEVSTINISPNQGVKMGEISVTHQNTMAIRIENDGVAGLVSNRDYQADDVPPGEVEPDTRSEFLTASILTTPQSKLTSPLLSHHTWGMARGRGMRREERNKFTELVQKPSPEPIVTGAICV